MGFTLLWIVAMGTAWLFMAACLTAKPFCVNPRIMTARFAIVVLPPLVLAGYPCLIAALLYAQNVPPFWMLPYFASWLIVFLIGAGVLFRRGARVVDGDMPRLTASDWPRGKLWVATAAGVFLTVYTVWLLDTQACQRLQRHLADGTALALSIGNTWVPEEQNAYPIYQEAFELLDAQHDVLPWMRQNFSLEPFGEADFDATAPVVMEMINRKRRVVDLLHQAAAKPHCYYGQSYASLSQTNAPNLLDLRHAAYLLVMDANRKAAQSDMAGALADIRVIRRMAKHALLCPGLISLYGSIVLDAIANEAMDPILAKYGGVSNEDIDLPVRVTPSYSASRLLPKIRQENASFVQIVADAMMPEEGQEGSLLGAEGSVRLGGDVKLPVPNLMYRLFLAEADIRSYQRATNPQTVLHFLEGKGVALPPPGEEGITGQPLGFWARICLPDLPNLKTFLAQVETSMHLSELGLAAEAYRSEHRHYPEALDDLVPGYIDRIALDPFDGKPLRMLSSPNGLVLYSVGMNGIDDGGKQQERTASQEIGEDIIFCLGEEFKRRWLQPKPQPQPQRRR